MANHQMANQLKKCIVVNFFVSFECNFCPSWSELTIWFKSDTLYLDSTRVIVQSAWWVKLCSAQAQLHSNLVLVIMKPSGLGLKLVIIMITVMIVNINFIRLICWNSWGCGASLCLGAWGCDIRDSWGCNVSVSFSSLCWGCFITSSDCSIGFSSLHRVARGCGISIIGPLYGDVRFIDVHFYSPLLHE